MAALVVPTCLKCRAFIDSNKANTMKTDEGKIKFYLHTTCELTCSNCYQKLETNSRCFVSNDCTKIYCTNCYRYCYENCNICNEIIDETDFAINFNGKFIHVQCMSCIICSKSLKKGQNVRFDQDSKKIFCEEHAEYPNSTSQSAATGIETQENGFPRPAYTYSCLITLALKNSYTGTMSVSEIYNFICEHFPYFKNAPSGWKDSVRQKLCMNNCFEKIEKSASSVGQWRGCLWARKPREIKRLDNLVKKWSHKDIQANKLAMAMPDCFDALERGEMKKDYNINPEDTEKIKTKNEN